MKSKMPWVLIALSLSSLVKATTTSSSSPSSSPSTTSNSSPSCLPTYTGNSLDTEVVCPTYDGYQFLDAKTRNYFVIHCNSGFQAPGDQPSGVTDATGCFHACIADLHASTTDVFWDGALTTCHCLSDGATLKPGDDTDIAFALSDQPACSSAHPSSSYTAPKSSGTPCESSTSTVSGSPRKPWRPR